MPNNAEQVRQGGWIAVIYNSIRDFNLDHASFDEYEAIISVARAAEFLSSIRALGTVDGKSLETYRKLASLRPKTAITAFGALEQIGALNVVWSSTTPKSAISVTSRVTSRAGILEAAGRLFAIENQFPKAACLIQVLEETSSLPKKQSAVISHLGKHGLDERVTVKAIDELVALSLLARTEETEHGDPLVHNPHSFRANAADAYKTLTGLSQRDQEAAVKLLQHVKKSPGVPFPSKTDKRLISLLTKIGAIDISGIQTAGSSNAGQFPTSPDAWGVFGTGGKSISNDLIDDSKLLLNCLRYGELYSQPGRGRIISPSVLIGALIDRGQVGAATAIGEDYPLPLARGIVGITESRAFPGRYFMELRKRDVVESVRDVLTQNVILPEPPEPPSLENSGDAFTSPETMRFKHKLPNDFIAARDNMIFDLRTYRNRK